MATIEPVLEEVLVSHVIVRDELTITVAGSAVPRVLTYLRDEPS